jgi:hypothetical protein
MIFAALVMLLVSLTNGPSTYQAGSPAAPAVRDLTPSPGARLRSFFPTVSAQIQPRGGAALSRASIHLFLDGSDVTAASIFNGTRVTYTPHGHIRAGWHDVFLEGKDGANQTFSQAWFFQTDDPDIDVPVDEAQFGFAPIVIGPGLGGPFMHFFFVSPFQGVALLQLCGFTTPFVQAPGTPVFFVTAPMTLGTLLLGCTPGVAFTPFGISQAAPIFFPLPIAGPNPIPNNPRRRPLPISHMPVYSAPAPIGIPRVGVPRVGFPHIGIPHVTVPRVSVPHPYVPH